MNLLSGTKALLKPNWHQMGPQDRLLHACLLAYLHHSDFPNTDEVTQDKLTDVLHNAICQAIGDKEYCRWSDMMKEEEPLWLKYADKCHQCGKPIPKDATWCGYCGSSDEDE